ncbi:MAG: peptidylprolyl isomerase, partial [Fusobacterium sp.]|nr:peptidylprolyl isomerase [Fusobacterium sp.]
FQGAGSTKEEIEKNARKNISNKIKLAKIAQKRGITVSDNLETSQMFNEYQNQLIKQYRTEINPSESELLKYFNDNKEKYAIKESFDMNLALVAIKPSKEDEKNAEEEAKKVLNSVTINNFKNLGQELTKEKGYLFEELGTFSKGMMVKEFEDAVSSAEGNSVVKEVIKTGFGYHIIFVEEKDKANEKWKASHILVRITPSEKTISEKMDKMKKIKEDIVKGVVTFTEIQKLDEDIVQSRLLKGMTSETLISYLGFNPEVIEEINKADLNNIELVQIQSGILMFQKVKEVKFEEANFEKSKEIVRNDYINNQAVEYLKRQGL